MINDETSIRVLLVEDELAHAKLVLRAFRDSMPSAQVEVATSLSDARNAISRHTPDLLLCDLVLPDGRGLELIPPVPKEAAFPVVFLTAQGSEAAAVEAMKAGALDYVVKSESVLADISRVVERTLREWRGIQNLRRLEADLQRALQLFRDILDSLPLPVAVLDQRGVIVASNHAWHEASDQAALFGPQAQEGTSYIDFCRHSQNPAGQRIAEACLQVLEETALERLVEHCHREHGENRWFEMRVRPFSGHGTGRVVVMHQEITHRKQTEADAITRTEALLVFRKVTPRELQTLEMIVAGLSNREAADRVGLSIKTIEMHRGNVMKKVGAGNIADAIRLALIAFPEWRRSGVR